MEQTERKMIVAQVYILSGDPAYITNHKGARRTITQVDRHDLLKDILTDYFSARA